MYCVTIERSAAKSLARISEPWQSAIERALRSLANNPRPAGAKKLTGRQGWRIRVGDYRILYEIHDRVLSVLVIDIGHRREIYR